MDFARDLFAHSFLSFGAQEARLRLERFLLSNREALRDAADSRADRTHVPNPCAHRGFLGETPGYPALPHEGTGSVGETPRCDVVRPLRGAPHAARPRGLALQRRPREK